MALGEVALLQQLGLPRVSRLLSRQPQVSNCDGRRSACGGASTQEAQNPRIGWTWAEHLEDALLEEKRQEAPLRSVSLSLVYAGTTSDRSRERWDDRRREKKVHRTQLFQVRDVLRFVRGSGVIGANLAVLHTNPGQSSGFLSLGHHRRTHRQQRFSPFSI